MSSQSAQAQTVANVGISQARTEFMNEPKLGVIGVVTDFQGKILLGVKKRAFSNDFVGRWVLPGGRVNFGETCEEAIKREVLEETGIKADVGWRLPVQELIHPAGHFVFVCFEMEALTFEAKGADDLSEAGWFDYAALTRMWDSMTPVTQKVIKTLKWRGLPRRSS